MTMLETAIKVVDGQYRRIQALENALKEAVQALEMTAVRFTPALDGYCWCTRKHEPQGHKAFCLIGKKALETAKRALDQ